MKLYQIAIIKVTIIIDIRYDIYSLIEFLFKHMYSSSPIVSLNGKCEIISPERWLGIQVCPTIFIYSVSSIISLTSSFH